MGAESASTLLGVACLTQSSAAPTFARMDIRVSRTPWSTHSGHSAPAANLDFRAVINSLAGFAFLSFTLIGAALHWSLGMGPGLRGGLCAVVAGAVLTILFRDRMRISSDRDRHSA